MAGTGAVTGLIDTDILIDAARGVAHAKAFLNAQRVSAGIHISAVSAMELVLGCQDAAALAKTRRFLANVIELPLNPAATQIARHLVETFFLSHGLLIPDALIAATALEQSLPLYTRNTRHFQMIPGLSVVAPY